MLDPRHALEKAQKGSGVEIVNRKAQLFRESFFIGAGQLLLHGFHTELLPCHGVFRSREYPRQRGGVRRFEKAIDYRVRIRRGGGEVGTQLVRSSRESVQVENVRHTMCVEKSAAHHTSA